MKAILAISLAMSLIVFADTSVLAQEKHPMEIQQINEALKTAHISKAERAEVIKLRNQGSKFHYSGDHANAEIVLNQAMAILHIN